MARHPRDFPGSHLPAGLLLGQLTAKPIQSWKDWYHSCPADLRDCQVRKLVVDIFQASDKRFGTADQWIHNLVAYARKVEFEMYQAATSQSEYYHMLAVKTFSIQNELRERKRKKEEALRLQSGAMSLAAAQQSPPNTNCRLELDGAPYTGTAGATNPSSSHPALSNPAGSMFVLKPPPPYPGTEVTDFAITRAPEMNMDTSHSSYADADEKCLSELAHQPYEQGAVSYADTPLAQQSLEVHRDFQEPWLQYNRQSADARTRADLSDLPTPGVRPQTEEVPFQQALQQLMYTMKFSRRTQQKQEKIKSVLRSNKQLMAAFIAKRRAINPQDSARPAGLSTPPQYAQEGGVGGNVFRFQREGVRSHTDATASSKCHGNLDQQQPCFDVSQPVGAEGAGTFTSAGASATCAQRQSVGFDEKLCWNLVEDPSNHANWDPLLQTVQLQTDGQISPLSIRAIDEAVAEYLSSNAIDSPTSSS